MSILSDSELNIEKDRLATKTLIIKYPFEIIKMSISYAILLYINRYFDLYNNTPFKIITYLVGGGICIQIFTGLLSIIGFIISFPMGIYGRIFKTEYYGLVNRYNLINELMNFVYLIISCYIVYLILLLTS